jgi:hypothetical protein
MPRPPDPWEKEMMRDYQIDDVAQLRRIVAQPPHPKYRRSDEIRACQLEFEQCVEDYRHERDVDFFRCAPIVAKLTLYFPFRGT